MQHTATLTTPSSNVTSNCLNQTLTQSNWNSWICSLDGTVSSHPEDNATSARGCAWLPGCHQQRTSGSLTDDDFSDASSDDRRSHCTTFFLDFVSWQVSKHRTAPVVLITLPRFGSQMGLRISWMSLLSHGCLCFMKKASKLFVVNPTSTLSLHCFPDT